jgi:hypothetical protein
LLGIIVAVGFLAVSTCMVLNTQVTDTKARKWFEKSISELPTTADAEQIRQWLIRNGFTVVQWNPYDERGWIGERSVSENGQVEHLYVVCGFKLVGTNVWVNLEFLLDSTLHLKRVEYKTKGKPF